MKRNKGRAPARSFDVPAFKERWKTFLLRHVLVVHQRLGRITYDGGRAVPVAVEVPELPELIASLLYLDLVSLLEEALKSQMSVAKFKEMKDLEGRINYLADEGQILAKAKKNLQVIRARRNQIAHRLERVPAPELSHALDTVHQQLEAWDLVGPLPAYQFFWDERTEEPSGPEGFKRFVRVGVKHGENVILEYESLRYFDAD